MRRLVQGLGIVAIVILLVACDQTGNNGPDMTPGQEGTPSTMPAPGAGPCKNGVTKQTLGADMTSGVVADGSGNCVTVPDPYGAAPKKDGTPKISFPDYNAITPEISALPGNAYSLLVSTANVTTLSVSCDPATGVSLTPNSGIPGSYLFYLGGMPGKDVSCTLSGSGDNGSATATLIFHPAPDGYVEKLEVRNLPTQVSVDVEQTFQLNNFYVRGFDKTTTVKVACTSGQSPKLVNVVGKMGWYSMVVSGPADVGMTEGCTVSASRSSDGQTAASTVKLSTPGIEFKPGITAENFKDGDVMFMTPLNINTANYVALTGNYKDQPFPKITVHSLDSTPKLTIACTDNHGAGLVPACDAAPICTNKTDYVECQAACGKPGDKDYYVCINNCTDKFYTPCGQATCPITNYASEVISLGKMAQPSDTYEYQIFINYKDIGKPDSVDTCTITAVNDTGGKATYSLAVKHVIPILKPTTQQAIKTGQIVYSDSFKVFLYDNATQVTVTCTLDNNPKLISINIPGIFYFTTVAPNKIGDNNICTVMVAHGNTAPVAYRLMTVTASQ